MLKRVNNALQRACLRRDAYLDHVFSHEAKALRDELPGCNSPDARAYLQGKLEELDRVPVNFSLSPATIELVNGACKDLNVVRDCFINRVLFLLVADAIKCETIVDFEFRRHLGDILGENDRDYICAPLWNGGVDAVYEIVSSDPFWALRNIIEHARDEWGWAVRKLHACLIRPELFSNKPPGLIALNCYLRDEDIPESPAWKRNVQLAEEALAAFLGEPIPPVARTTEVKEAE